MVSNSKQSSSWETNEWFEDNKFTRTNFKFTWCKFIFSHFWEINEKLLFYIMHELKFTWNLYYACNKIYKLIVGLWFVRGQGRWLVTVTIEEERIKDSRSGGAGGVLNNFGIMKNI